MGAEKAGVAKRGLPLVTLAQPPEAIATIERVAAANGALLFVEGREWHIDDSLTPSLPGLHQLRNASLAAEMARRYGVGDAYIRSGIASARWPARFQKLGNGPLARGRKIWIDGAHNPAAAHALAAMIAGRKLHIILGILANKDAEGIVAPLAAQAASLTFVDVPGHASHDAQALAGHWSGRSANDLSGATDALTDDILIAGSLYLCGEALRLNEQQPD